MRNVVHKFVIYGILNFLVYSQGINTEAKFKLTDTADNDLADSVQVDLLKSEDTIADIVQAKEETNFNVQFTGSFGFVNGKYLTNSPVGGSLTITTPFGFRLGPLDFNTSIALGSYGGEVGSRTFDLLVAGIGGNVTLANFLFYEGHVGLVGAGAGGRGFGGVSLERLLSNSLNLPVNILIGGEGFIALTPEDGAEDATYWGGLGVRLDYNF